MTADASGNEYTDKPEWADTAPLIARVREFIAERDTDTRSNVAPLGRAELASGFGFTEKGKGIPEVILGDDVAVELGHPSTASLSIVLLTRRLELVEDGRVTVVGPDVGEIGRGDKRPFAQILMLGVARGSAPDPFTIDNAQYLMQRFRGYVVRSVPGRLWARVSRRGLADGLTFNAVGSALRAVYKYDFEGIEKVETLFVTSSVADVEALKPVAIEADILAGKHKKLALGIDGEIECTELDCETCDEKPVCDNLRDIVIKRRNIKV